MSSTVKMVVLTQFETVLSAFPSLSNLEEPLTLSVSLLDPKVSALIGNIYFTIVNTIGLGMWTSAEMGSLVMYVPGPFCSCPLSKSKAISY